MYAEISSTGFNLIDLGRREVLMIRDSLALARGRSGLTPAERDEINLLITRITNELEQLAPGQFSSQL